MNCFIWILLLLGCCGNCSDTNNYCYENTNCGCNNRCNGNRRTWNRCDCNRCENMCDNMIQPRVVEDCGCDHHHHHDNECITPPPVPRYVMQEDNCGCNN